MININMYYYYHYVAI